MKESLATMKGSHWSTLTALVKHLVNVLEADNRMSAENLALVFGPNIMWDRRGEKVREKEEEVDGAVTVVVVDQRWW